MKINLINLEASEVKYELTTFPDGEPHIKLEEIDRKDSYRVICRITNPSELFILMQVADILDRQEVQWDLVITYLMTQRMDRVITFNEAFSLKLIASIFNGFNCSKIEVLSLHSDVLQRLLPNKKISEIDEKLRIKFRFEVFNNQSGDKTICYPDNGALTRYRAIDFENDYFLDGWSIWLNKKRDLANKGKIISIEFEHIPVNMHKTILISDDLCDAGGTFVWAAKILKERFPDKKLQIFVRHMVNPIGIKNLSENFDDVYFTNSYKDWDNLPKNCHLINITNYL